MTAETLARARGARNPFLLDRVDSAWDGAFTDVGSINHTAFTHCTETIETVRETHQSRGLLLTGEPGSGKSHLLHRLRHAIGAGGKDIFVYVSPAASTRLFGQLLRRVVEDILKSHAGAATQLETMIVRALLPGDSRVTPTQIWSDKRRRSPPGPVLFATLDHPFEQLVQRIGLNPDLALVLRHYLAEHHRLDAYRWLKGDSVPEAALERLGVARTLEEDSDAREALFELSKLAGHSAVIVLAFDQLEGMQLRPDDLDGVRGFGNAVAELLIHCRNIAAISCVQQYFHADLAQTLPPAHLQRIAQDLGRIELLRYADAEAIVGARLARDEDLNAARCAADANELWPLTADGLRNALQPNPGGGIAARAVLNAARMLYAKWQAGDGEPRALPASSGLTEHFEALQADAAAQAADEDTLSEGLLKLLDLKQPGAVRRSTIRGIDLEVDRPAGKTGIAVCHTQNMRSLAARLNSVRQALDQNRIHKAVIVRDERLPITASARVTRERLRALQDAGHPFLSPGAAAYAAIAAARKLLAEAASGELSVDGRAVSPEDVRAWLLTVRPRAAFEVLDELDADGSDPALGGPADEVLDRMRTALDGSWVLSLPQISERLELDSAKVVQTLGAGRHMVGILAGPPAVLFLRPDGLRRG